jgi:hypothetical protein
MSGFKLQGTDELIKELEGLEQRAKDLNGTHELKFEEILTSEFMNKYTDYFSINEMLDASGFKIESNEDFDKIPVDKLDEFIKEHTRFPSWEEMIGTAGEEFVVRKLGL